MKNCGSLLVVALLFVLSGCFSGLESDLERSIERDDRLVKEFLQRNNLDPIEAALGYYFIKEQTNDAGEAITNGDVLGIYYEIRTLEGQLIEAYFDENLPPRIFSHREGGMVPSAINFASGLAREGEILNLFIPSYLAYQEFSFQQLISPNSNLNVRVKYAKIYSEEELKDIEQEMISNYIAEENLEGFEKSPEELHKKLISEGDDEGPVASVGNVVFFTFQLFQVGEPEAISEITSDANPFQISLGGSSNLDFLNLSLEGLRIGAELEVISPSYLAFGATTQVIPFQVRRDLFFQNYIPQIARPFEPLMMKAKIVHISG
jgi:FKBP-type peptidyl-prolyl cis-trans isomerase 2